MIANFFRLPDPSGLSLRSETLPQVRKGVPAGTEEAEDRRFTLAFPMTG